MFNILPSCGAMKKLWFTFFGLVFALAVNAQRFAVVDTDLILNKMPKYTSAQKQLDQLSGIWEGEVQAIRSEIDALRKAYEAEKVLLTDEMKASREKEIAEKEKKARELQRKYFGPDGELFKKRVQLIKPLQDQIYNAIQEIAQRRNLDVVFDKGSELITLYLNERVNISDQVLQKLKEVEE